MQPGTFKIDSLMVRIWWETPDFEEDTSLAGYFVCPVDVTGSFSPSQMEITYEYWPPYLPYSPLGPLGKVTIPVQNPPPMDSLTGIYIFPQPPEPAYFGEHHIVHTAPLRRNVWQSSMKAFGNLNNYLGQYYSILPVDYSGNVDTSEDGDGWSPWFYVPYTLLHAGIAESKVSPGIPFSLQVLEPAISSNSVTIKYSLPERTKIELNIFDVAGRMVKSLYNGFLCPGYHETQVNLVGERGLRLSAGVYFVKLVSEERSVTEKIVIVR